MHVRCGPGEKLEITSKAYLSVSHAACYAVVAYQTAYLRTYYPVEFMAALMTSVIDNGSKVSEYINTCKSMGIGILPPDINQGQWGFSVSGKHILFGLSAIKGLGRNVVESITAEREAAGPFRDLKDLITRLSNKEVNKRTIENFIKAGALDSLPGSRRQKMMVYADIMDQKSREMKDGISGQLSLFDLMSEEDRSLSEVRFPEVEEYPKSEILSFEKDVLGIYVSGHPLDDDRTSWEKNITARAVDFVVDEESGKAQVHEGSNAVIGGMITAKTIKTTKNNQTMAFITLEDLTGSLEVIIFPRDYEKNRDYLEVDQKVFIRGRVSIGALDSVGKLVCERVLAFDAIPRDIWIQFGDMAEYKEHAELLEKIRGTRALTLYLASERAVRRLTGTFSRQGEDEFVHDLVECFGEGNVRVVEKKLEDVWKMR